ncbi:AHH domain-containing protein [Ruminococcus sp.]|uniref:AHH domain-containing protein n=1 Tax=Ruminococcus sp. TaxID=41978 RepID=UPI00258E3066|nr:AHH domain-containing protein [Ruminococcus sp.]MCR5022162.1 AHH domain-containing protein [Ruminococcus sp.]
MKRNRFLAVALSLSMLWGEVSSGVSFIKHGITALAAESNANHYSSVEKTSAMKYKGDVNGDGKITDDDKTLLQKWLVHMVNDSELDLEKADLNLDGKVTIRDFVELSILCGSTQISDGNGEGEYENVYTPEPRARVICNTKENNKEKIETKMTEEMADLVDHLKTPLAVYEYLYNNLNTEYYIGSRKGAIGAYEQKGGNDVDCSSLLIAMLRYLGYDADYVTGTVEVTADQLMGLTATDSTENAEKVFMLLGRPLTRSNGKYIFDRTWVKALIDGKEYQLDVNFKKFNPASGISDEIKAQNFDFDYTDYSSINDAEVLFNEYKEQISLTDVNISGRKLVNEKITKLPLDLPYTCKSNLEEIHNISESSIVKTDYITIAFGTDDYDIPAPEAYISTVSVQYVPNSKFYKQFEDLGIIDKPSSIYSSTDEYDGFISTQKKISPALYIDNKKVYEWDTRVAIGDKQKMYVLTNTCGQDRRYIESRELIVGAIVSIVIDTQVISPQSLFTAYENYKSIKNTINKNNFFESSYCDNYLNFIGNSYFAQLDIQNMIYSSVYNVYKERELSFGLFTYEPNVETTTVFGYTSPTKLQKQGNFGLDILGAYNQALSLSGNENDVKSYLFASGYVSSYLESQTLQQFTGVKSVSTAEVFRQCTEKGIDLKMVSSENEEIIETLQINDDDKAEITQKVKEGYLVIVPEKNISINQWTGTAYIVQSRDGTQNTFIITGDKNGGYSTVDIVAYMIIATIGSGVDMFGMVFGFVGIISACLALPVAPIIAYAAAGTAMVAFAKMASNCIEDYQETVNLYFNALDGDEEAANKLNKKAFLATVSMFFDFATGGFDGSKGPGPDDIPKPDGRKTTLSGKGYTDDVVDDIFSMQNVDSCSDELLDSIASSSKPSYVSDTLSDYSDDIIERFNWSPDKDRMVSFVADHGDKAVEFSAKSSPKTLRAISELPYDKADSFFKTASKNVDEITIALNKSNNIDDAVAFIATHSDDGAEIFIRHGDAAIEAVNACDAPFKAVQIIKNGGLQYGDEAVQAIKKSGNKAIEALTKVPSKECADIIVKYDDDVVEHICKSSISQTEVDLITKYGDDVADPNYLDKFDVASSKLNDIDKAYKSTNDFFIRVSEYRGTSVSQSCEVSQTAIANAQKNNRNNDPGILREALYEAGVTPPQYDNQAHHIVAKNAEKATYSREVLEGLDIDLNSASNGILLPIDRTATHAVTESIHNGGHLESYYQYVNEEIRSTLIQINPEWENATDLKSILKNLPESEKSKVKTEICNTLSEIKQELLDGDLIIHN